MMNQNQNEKRSIAWTQIELTTQANTARTAIAVRWIANCNEQPQPASFRGSRIFNLDELSKEVKQLTEHSANCGGSCIL